jgi:hypothetical protein
MRSTKTFTIILFLLTTCLTMLVATAADVNAQCKPGEQIEYKAQNWPEKWEAGTCVKELPGGTQVLVQEKPNQFYPEGFHRAYAVNDIRPVRQAEEKPAKPDAAPLVDNKTPLRDAAKDEAPVDAKAGGLMTREEILQYLKDRIGSNPWTHPKKPQVVSELVDLIRGRGVDFRDQIGSEFENTLRNSGGNETTIPYAIKFNYGAPTKLDWYVGTWNTSQTSVNNWWLIGAKTGFLTIDAKGTYVWKLYVTDPPANYVKGAWRKATAAEMAVSYYGGDGIVLLNAKGNTDWIVMKERATTMKGDWIQITYLETYSRSQTAEGGYRR